MFLIEMGESDMSLLLSLLPLLFTYSINWIWSWWSGGVRVRYGKVPKRIRGVGRDSGEWGRQEKERGLAFSF